MKKHHWKTDKHISVILTGAEKPIIFEKNVLSKAETEMNPDMQHGSPTEVKEDTNQDQPEAKTNYDLFCKCSVSKNMAK